MVEIRTEWVPYTGRVTFVIEIDDVEWRTQNTYESTEAALEAASKINVKSLKL